MYQIINIKLCRQSKTSIVKPWSIVFQGDNGKGWMQEIDIDMW